MQLQTLLNSLAALVAGLMLTVGATHPTQSVVPPTAAPGATHATSTTPTAIRTSSLTPTPAPKAASVAPAAPKTALDSAPSSALALALGKLRDGTVNIVCATRDNSVRSISGSGVFISSKGLILTVAHVGQYFLLHDIAPNNVQCVIRTGNPARNAYLAEPVYVSSLWVHRYPDTLTATAPTGTGQDDIAVLMVTDTATETPLPSTFPFVPLTDSEPTQNEPVAIGSYAAQTLTNDQIRSSLYETLTFGTLQKRFTFTTDTVDVLSLGGSVAAQEGSSGGGVVNDKGELVGLITTSSVSGALSSRDLRAITVGHIRRSYSDDVGQNFDTLILKGNAGQLADTFVTTARTLAHVLKSGLSMNR